MSAPRNEEPFPELKTFDEKDFAPPAWASAPPFRNGSDEPLKHGESSRSGVESHLRVPEDQPRVTPMVQLGSDKSVRPDIDQRRSRSAHSDVASKGPSKKIRAFGEEDDADDSEEDQEWVDAAEEFGLDPETTEFTYPALKKLLEKGQALREEGNTSYSSRPAQLQEAIAKYRAALKYLPDMKPSAHDTQSDDTGVGTTKKTQPETKSEAKSGIEEVTEDEAEAIVAEEQRKAARRPEDAEMDELKDDVRECAKACWGNLGACYATLGDDAEVVKTCTEALKLDPHYAKALSRRALANERIGSWSSVEAALKDNQLLLQLLPPASPQLPGIRRALATLPDRILKVKEEETAKMMGQLKDLGNSVLGWFGMSTDNFKFDQQPGGGYSMRWEQ